MKTLIFAVALMAGTAAIAQDTGTMTQSQTPDVTNTRVNDGTPPERDARGIPVISAPAVVPAGANEPVTAPPGANVVVSPNQASVFNTRQSAQDYPPCTRTVTDNCVQTYERGRQPS